MRCAGLVWRERRSQGRNTPCTRGRRRKVTRLLKKHPPRLQTCHVWYGSHLFSQHNSLNTWVRDILDAVAWGVGGDGEWRELGGGGVLSPSCLCNCLSSMIYKKKKKKEGEQSRHRWHIHKNILTCHKEAKLFWLLSSGDVWQGPHRGAALERRFRKNLLKRAENGQGKHTHEANGNVTASGNVFFSPEL